jgi:hypothetical protein
MQQNHFLPHLLPSLKLLLLLLLITTTTSLFPSPLLLGLIPSYIV